MNGSPARNLVCEGRDYDKRAMREGAAAAGDELRLGLTCTRSYSEHVIPTPLPTGASEEPVSEVRYTFSCRTPCDEIPVFTGMTRL